MTSNYKNAKHNLSIAQSSNRTSSTKTKNPFDLFDNFSPNASKYLLDTREEQLLNKNNNQYGNSNYLSLNTLKNKSSLIPKTILIKFPIALTPYQQYEKLRENSFKQLKMKLELSRPFNTHTHNNINAKNTTVNVTTTKENKRKDCYDQTQSNYSNRRITQEEIDSIANILSKKYNIKEEVIKIKRKSLMLKKKKTKSKKGNRMIKLFCSPLHKIKLSYCKSYQNLNQSPIECFSI